MKWNNRIHLKLKWVYLNVRALFENRKCMKSGVNIFSTKFSFTKRITSKKTIIVCFFWDTFRPMCHAYYHQTFFKYYNIPLLRTQIIAGQKIFQVFKDEVIYQSLIIIRLIKDIDLHDDRFLYSTCAWLESFILCIRCQKDMMIKDFFLFMES